MIFLFLINRLEVFLNVLMFVSNHFPTFIFIFIYQYALSSKSFCVSYYFFTSLQIL